MKIAYFSSSTVPSRTADSVHVMKMCNAFAASGHTVRLYARRGKADPGDLFEYYGVANAFELVRIPTLRLRGLGPASYASAVATHVAATWRDVDLLYARDRLAAVLAAPLGVPTVFEVHQVPDGARLALERLLLRRSNLARLVAISGPLAGAYQREFPWFDPQRVLIAHDGADLPTEEQGSLVTGSPRLQVGYVGHLYPGRGVEVIVELAKRKPQHAFHLVGGEDEAVARWRQATQDVENLEFHGFVSPAEAETLRSKMDVLLAPYQLRVSTEDGSDTSWCMSPLKVFEYMAAGKGIIVSDLPVLHEVLEHDVHALFVQPADVSAWEQALTRLESAEERARLGSAARERLAAELTWLSRAQKVIEGLP